MSKDKFEQQMDKQIKNNDFNKFLAYFYQYLAENKTDPHNLVYYKTIALLYFLANEQYENYYALIQSCIDVENYEYVMNVYDSINLCDFTRLDHLQNNADVSYKHLIQEITQNIREKFNLLAKEVKLETNNKSIPSVQENNILECLHVIDKFRK
ncbi:hypothetical protein NUSPORA_01685 [Nucleospora cyclopteri]